MVKDTVPGTSVTGFTISDLSERTGVPQATLRTWEARYGAPMPRRLPGGHRRYAERDVALVERVLAHRSMGLSLETAVARAAAVSAEPEPSVFAGLRKRHPELAPRILTKRTLLAVTRAIEDECCARAAQPILFASFQSKRFYRQSQARWHELARTAQHVTVFADFDDPGSVDRVTRVRVPSDAPLAREWLLVCEAPDYPACLAGWELPGQDGADQLGRRYEALWTLDPPTVRDAAQICVGLCDSFDQPLTEVAEMLDDSAPPASPDLHRAMSLFNRVVGYVDTPQRDRPRDR